MSDSQRGGNSCIEVLSLRKDLCSWNRQLLSDELRFRQKSLAACLWDFLGTTVYSSDSWPIQTTTRKQRLRNSLKPKRNLGSWASIRIQFSFYGRVINVFSFARRWHLLRVLNLMQYTFLESFRFFSTNLSICDFHVYLECILYKLQECYPSWNLIQEIIRKLEGPDAFVVTVVSCLWEDRSDTVGGHSQELWYNTYTLYLPNACE